MRFGENFKFIIIKLNNQRNRFRTHLPQVLVWRLVKTGKTSLNCDGEEAKREGEEKIHEREANFCFRRLWTVAFIRWCRFFPNKILLFISTCDYCADFRISWKAVKKLTCLAYFGLDFEKMFNTKVVDLDFPFSVI